MHFVGNIFHIFDAYPVGSSHMIFQGNSSDIKGVDGKIDVCIGSSVQWTKGIHTFSVKSMTDGHRLDAFGITTNIDKFCKIKKWYARCATDANAETYAMNGCESKSITMRQINDGKFGSRTQAGDIIVIMFDGDNWEVSFFVNGIEQAEPMKITPDLTYSPFIALNGYISGTPHYQICYD